MLLSGSVAYAQMPSLQQSGTAAQANLDALVDGSPTMVPRGGAYGTKGSPYLDSRWLPARLELSSRVALAPVPLKFDVLDKRLLMKPVNRPADSLLLDDRLVVGFELDEPATAFLPARTRVFRRFTEAPDLRQQVEYVEVLHKGRYTLLKQYQKQLARATYQQAYNNGQRYDEIKDQNQYYLLKPDKTLVPLKLTLKMLQAAAPELALKTVPGASKASTEADWVAVLAAAENK